MKVKNIIYAGLMIALVFIATFSIKIPIPFTQGYVHLGDSMIFIAAILFGWKIGGIAGGFGSALADLLGGYAMWAFPTLIIKFFMGALIGFLVKDLKKKENKTLKTVINAVSIAVWVFAAIFTITYSNSLKNAVRVDNDTAILEELELSNASEMVKTVTKFQISIVTAIIIVFVLCFIVSYFLKKKNIKFLNFTTIYGMTLAGLWMTLGYFITEKILYGSYVVAVFGIPWNIFQFMTGLIISIIVVLGLKKINSNILPEL